MTELVRLALEEDIGAGDATVLATILARATGKARILAREDLICAGLPMAERVFRALDSEMKIELLGDEGEQAKKGTVLVQLHGKARAILLYPSPAPVYRTKCNEVAAKGYEGFILK